MMETVLSIATRIKDALADEWDETLPPLTPQQIAALALALHANQSQAQSETKPTTQRQRLADILVFALADGQYLPKRPTGRADCKVLCKMGQLEPNGCMGYRITAAGREAIGL